MTRFIALVILCAATLQFSAQRAEAGIAKDTDLSDFNHIDPNNLVPDVPLRRAMAYFKRYKRDFDNHTYVAVIDYTKHASVPRFFIINVKTGKVERLHVSHGRGSDPSNSGWAKRFSNRPNSNATSLGFYKTGEIYFGQHGRSMRLDGLSGTNTNARNRGIVIHSAWYVQEGKQSGRSQGCPAVDRRKRDAVLAKLKGGALVYTWGGQGAG